MPKFSIIIPCYNAQDTIAQTLESLRKQTFTDWEAICIDDGSSDDTMRQLRLAALNDNRIRYVYSMRNGPSAARNQGVFVHALGEIVAFCDADDLWQPRKLADLAMIFQNPSVDGAFGRVGFFKNCPGDANVFSSPPEGTLSIDLLLGENPVCTMSNIAVRRSAFVTSGGFDEGMVHNEDLEWLIRLVGKGSNIVSLPSLQTWYRTSIGGLSTNLGAMLTGRARALETAASFGVRPNAACHAIHYRYLARRALRTGAGRFDALRLAALGLCLSPAGFFSPFRRGALTFSAAVFAVLLPRSVSASLFS